MEIVPPPAPGYGLYIECRWWHDWPLGSWGRYLSLRSVQHQIVEFAEDALLQLVPGDTPVLMHEKWRAEPEEDEEKEKKEEHQGRRGWLMYVSVADSLLWPGSTTDKQVEPYLSV